MCIRVAYIRASDNLNLVKNNLHQKSDENRILLNSPCTLTKIRNLKTLDAVLCCLLNFFFLRPWLRELLLFYEKVT